MFDSSFQRIRKRERKTETETGRQTEKERERERERERACARMCACVCVLGDKHGRDGHWLLEKGAQQGSVSTTMTGGVGQFNITF